MPVPGDTQHSFKLLRSPKTGRGLILAGACVIVVHLCLSFRSPTHPWITPTFWIAMNVLALLAIPRYAMEAVPQIRWRWILFALNLLLTIGSLVCILCAEYHLSDMFASGWLNDLLRAFRGLPLLLALCTPEEQEHRENRILDILQLALMAFIFLVMFSPVLLSQLDLVSRNFEIFLVNSYHYTQLILLALVAILGIFTAKTPSSRLFHIALSIFLGIGGPISIWCNAILTNTRHFNPSSPMYVPITFGLFTMIAVLPFLHPRTSPANARRGLVFLRLGVSGLIPLFVLLASMLLAVAGNHPLLGITTGLLSLTLYGLRSTYGQFWLLSTQWELESANQRLRTLSQHDPLTGLYNRRWFSEALLREYNHSLRNKVPLSLLLLDIDHFKLFNDTLGHSQGDICLCAVAQVCLKQLLRNNDALVRYGGEEFVAMLPDTDADGAHAVANRIMTELAALRIPHPASPLGIATVSIGATTWSGANAKTVTPEKLFQLADKALYQAKSQGRNCVRFAVNPSAENGQSAMAS